MSTLPSLTYVGNFLSGHGLNPTYSELLVPELRSVGYDVAVASTRMNPFLRLADVARRIVAAPSKRGCVIIDLYSGPRAFRAAAFAAGLCRKLGKRYIIVLHGGMLPERLKTSRKPLERILSGARSIVSPSRYLASNLAEVCQAVVIPNAIRLSDYPFRARSGIQGKCFFLRALHRNYGPLVAIEALSLVARAHPQVQLRMAGPEMDDCRPDCERLIERTGLDGRVSLLGRISKAEVRKEGDGADIFLNPTFVDNTPVSVVEAMAMGLCIVSTNVGGLSYLLEDGTNALLVAPRDPQAIAQRISDLLQDPDLALRISTGARREAEKMDWGCVLPAWHHVIEDALA